MNMSEFIKCHRDHPLSNAFNLMRRSHTKEVLRDYFIISRALIELLKYQGQLTEDEANTLFADVDSQAMRGKDARTLQ